MAERTAPRPPGALAGLVRREPSSVLLAVQVLGILIYPFLEDSVAGRSVTAGLGLLVLAAAVLTVRASQSLTWVAVALGGPAMVLLVVQAISDSTAWAPFASGLEFLLYLYTAAAMIRHLVHDDRVTRDDLVLLAAVFTLLMWAFAHLFVVVQAVWPGSFTAALHPHQARTWLELLFLSCTTLSSTGLSDVVPVLPQARSVVMLEQMTGVFYIAMIVTRLVGQLTSRRDS